MEHSIVLIWDTVFDFVYNARCKDDNCDSKRGAGNMFSHCKSGTYRNPGNGSVHRFKPGDMYREWLGL
jgi:hypothetical protein